MIDRLAICNETFSGDDWPLDQALACAADAGYRGWEVAPFMLGDAPLLLSGAARREYRQRVERAGLQVIGLHWLLAKTSGFHLTSDDAATIQATADYLTGLAILCRDLGGDRMVLGSPLQRQRREGIDEATAMTCAARVLDRVIPTLEATDVRIALEPLGPAETNFMNTADSARQLQARIGSDRIALHLDVKAMSSEQASMPTIIAAHADWLLHFHANDPNRLGPGMGDVPVQPYVDALAAVRYRGWISVEVFDYSPGAATIAQQSATNLRQAIAAIPASPTA
jgi:sugar phosphate isomerase/epimerase